MKVSKKEKILAAARKLFVRQGFSGTSINQVEAESNVTRSLIFHYFTNKAQLWLEVKAAIVNDAKGKLPTLPSTEQAFPSFLAALITRSIHFYQGNPDITRMINWQRMEHNKRLNIGISASKEMQRWVSAIKHYQKIGDVRKTYKAEYVVTLILSIVSTFSLDQNTFLRTAASQKAYIAFCTELVQKALR